MGETAHQFDVEVFDLRHGRRMRSADRPPVGPFRKRAVRTALTRPVATPTVHDDVTSLVLAKSGDVAWIGEDLDHANFEVHALNARHNRALDSGADIDPKSLKLRAGSLSWTRNGVRKTATPG